MTNAPTAALSWTSAKECPDGLQVNPVLNHWTPLGKEDSVASCKMELKAVHDATIDKCVEQKRVALKAVVKKGLVSGVHLLAALERYATNEAEDKAACLKTWKKLLQSCWEYEIVAEEDIRAWNEDERAAAKLHVQNKDAQKLREKSLAFFEWLEQGE